MSYEKNITGKVGVCRFGAKVIFNFRLAVTGNYRDIVGTKQAR